MAEKLMKTISTADNLTGIKGDIVLPKSFYAADNGSDYFNFYLGLGFDLMEGGISYSKKFGATPWHKFLNPGAGGSAVTSALSNQPAPGARISLRLENNGDHTASMYVNDNLVTTLSNKYLGATTYVKMCQGAGEWGNVTYSQASFSNLQYRTSDGVWHSWNSGFSADYKLKSSDMTVYSEMPLSTALS